MGNKSEAALLNSCRYMLQVHQTIFPVGQTNAWFALNTTFTVFSLILTFSVMFSLFKPNQMQNSPLKIVFVYACFNDLLFALMGQLKYSTSCYTVQIPCYVYVVFLFFTEFAHSQAVNLLLINAYARFIYAKYVTDVKSRINIRRVKIALIITSLYTLLHIFAPIIPFIVKHYSLYMVGKLINAILMTLVIILIFSCYLKGFKCIQFRRLDRHMECYLNLAGRKYFFSMVSIMSMIFLLHFPYTLSTIMETVFVYTGNHSIPPWCKYYHLVSNTIHRLFPAANQSVFIYNNSEIRLFMIRKIKSKMSCSTLIRPENDDGPVTSANCIWSDRLPSQRFSFLAEEGKSIAARHQASALNQCIEGSSGENRNNIGDQHYLFQKCFHKRDHQDGLNEPSSLTHGIELRAIRKHEHDDTELE